MRILWGGTVLLLSLVAVGAFPEAGGEPHGERELPGARSYRVRQGESLLEIGRRFGLGYQQMRAANPGIDPFLPGLGTPVTIPRGWIVPQVPRRPGLVVNLSEMRLYLQSTKGTREATSFPIGVGIEGNDTPLGEFRIVEKLERPSWHVPTSIRQKRPYLPQVIPPGPENPLGSHALRLSQRSILIHGTNKPWGVGMRVSHGCIRLYPEDIKRLYREVTVGTGVRIVRQPVKMLVAGERVYVEVHEDPAGPDYFRESFRLIVENGVSKRVDLRRLVQAIFEKKGYPVEVSRH